MIAQDMAHLFHQLQFGVGFKFRLVFHIIEYCNANMENAR